MAVESAFRRVLIALDGSDDSKQALDFALAKVIHPGRDQVVLLHVSPSHHKGEADPDLLEDYRRHVANHGVGASTIAAQGDAKEVIVSTADSQAADLLIVGSHGKGMAKRLLLGSVSDYCAHNAPCPVLVYRPKPKS